MDKKVEVGWKFTPDNIETYMPIEGVIKINIVSNNLTVGRLEEMVISELETRTVAQLL